MKDGPVYKYYVWPLGGEMEFFTENQVDEAYEYAASHGVGVKFV